MEISAMESGQAMEIKEIKDWSFDDFLHFSILQALRAATEDTIRYSLCVTNLEALMIDELEKNEEYINSITKKKKELDKEYGDLDENQMIKLGEMAGYKFRELIKIMKFNIPKETIGEI